MAAGQIFGFTSLQAPSGSIGDDAVSSANPLGVTKTRRLISKFTNFGFAIGATPTTLEVPVHASKVAGSIRNFRCGLEETGTSTSIAFDLRKYNAGNPGGVSVLSAAVTITHGTTDRALQAGTISTPTTVADDWFTILMTVTSSTGAAGPYAEVEFDETAV